MTLFRISCLLILFSVISCANDDSGSMALPPANLTIVVDESKIISGVLKVTAEADKANYYTINFGEQPGFVRSDQGEWEYVYETDGTYTLIVRAHTTETVYIEESTTVSIAIDHLAGIEGYSTPLSYDGYTLIWNDEFDGDVLSSDWTFEIGTGSSGWGNNELQYYRKENTTVADGYLTITAKKEDFGGQNYTSSRIITKGSQSFKYGRIDIRALLPQGQGIWPALWMLGDNITTVGWPKCGEIDIMEMIGGENRENTVHGTLHWDDAGTKVDYGESYTLASGIFADEFHVFTIIWDAHNIKWYVNDQHYLTIDTTPAELSEFHENFFLIFNVAVGGNWPGSPDTSTSFPQKMIVDYVRVFQPE